MCHSTPAPHLLPGHLQMRTWLPHHSFPSGLCRDAHSSPSCLPSSNGCLQLRPTSPPGVAATPDGLLPQPLLPLAYGVPPASQSCPSPNCAPGPRAPNTAGPPRLNASRPPGPPRATTPSPRTDPGAPSHLGTTQVPPVLTPRPLRQPPSSSPRARPPNFPPPHPPTAGCLAPGFIFVNSEDSTPH